MNNAPKITAANLSTVFPPVPKPPLTARGRQQLERYIDGLIDVAAQGNAGFAGWHADDIENIVIRHARKR